MRPSNRAWCGETHHAFTLIEILTVIAIITILAALTFPVFSRVQENGRKTVCEGHLQQWGHAFALYVSDYDEVYPKGIGEVIGEGWAGTMWPYVKNLTVAHCPDDLTLPIAHEGITAYPISYAFNHSIACGNIANNQWGPNKLSPLSAFTAPSSTVLLLEVSGGSATINLTPETRKASQQLSATAGAFSPSDGRMNKPPNEIYDWVPQNVLYATGWNYGAEKAVPNATPTFGPSRHGDGANYLMADGHVKWLPPDAVSYGGSNSDAQAGESLPTGPPYHNNYSGLAAGTGGLALSHKQVTMSIR